MSTETPSPHRVVPPSRRRDKPILSCNLCRRRKLKCDRQQPCRTCVDRGLSLSCAYTRTIPGPAHEQKPNNVHDRIDQLEKLVASLVHAKDGDNGSPNTASYSTPPLAEQGQSPSDGSVEGETPAVHDRVKLHKDATSYVDGSHWSSILDGISELKDELDKIPITAQSRRTIAGEVDGPDLLFGRQRHATKSELLGAIPTRVEAEELVNKYFSYMDMAPSVVHRPTFSREFENFWERPSETPVMWLGLLFAIFSTSVRFQTIIEEAVDGQFAAADGSLRSERMDFYREKVVQCLILANYTKGPPYTIETMMHYFILEYFQSQDSQFGTFMLIGMIVRIAFRMGYHREPSRFPNISPFKAEMRRRLWATIVQLDLMSSAQVGLPRMIQNSMHNVQEARNLIDDDLHENMQALPSSRPMTDLTPMLFKLIGNRVLILFARVTDLTTSMSQPPYREVMELDANLRTLYDSMPQDMKGIRASNIGQDDSDVALRKLYLGMVFLKAELMLHRPFHLLGRTDPRYDYSRLVCLDAALEILAFQRALDEQSQPGGRLWSPKWKLWSASWRLSSLINHDFLLATTVLSLDLDRDLGSPLATTTETSRERFKSGQPAREEIIEALSNAYGIWSRTSDTSREAMKIAAALKIVLRKANVKLPGLEPQTTPSTFETTLSQGNVTDFSQSASSTNTPNLDSNAAYLNNFNNFVPQFAPQFPASDIPLDMSTFDWGGLEFESAFPAFEQNAQGPYLG